MAMAMILKFPAGPMERTNARTFILPDDENVAINFAHVLRRLEEIIRDKQIAALNPANVIVLDEYRGAYAP